MGISQLEYTAIMVRLLSQEERILKLELELAQLTNFVDEELDYHAMRPNKPSWTDWLQFFLPWRHAR